MAEYPKMISLSTSLLFSLFCLCGLAVASPPSDLPSNWTISEVESHSQAPGFDLAQIVDGVQTYVDSVLSKVGSAAGIDSEGRGPSILDDFPTAQDLGISEVLSQDQLPVQVLNMP
jgi:hypothetical protein